MHHSSEHIRFWTVVAIWLLAGSAGAEPLFEDHSLIEVRLTGPLQSLLHSTRERNELPFEFSANGVTHDVKVRIRGKSRADLCKFPPLRINFQKDHTSGTVFAGQDKLKLVTHCRKSSKAQADTLQEYLAYRIFNIISPIGYRVRLLRVTYAGTESDRYREPITGYAFFLESKAALAARTGTDPVKVSGVSLRSLDDGHMAAVYVFQYLIGNTDWSLVTAEGDDSCCHNGNIVEADGKRFFVPYDFDLAGLVNAPYARPDGSLRINRVTQRLYRGFCTDRDALRDAVQAIHQARPEIDAILTEIDKLEPNAKKSAATYINRYYRQAADVPKLLRRFEKRCL